MYSIDRSAHRFSSLLIASAVFSFVCSNAIILTMHEWNSLFVGVVTNIENRCGRHRKVTVSDVFGGGSRCAPFLRFIIKDRDRLEGVESIRACVTNYKMRGYGYRHVASVRSHYIGNKLEITIKKRMSSLPSACRVDAAVTPSLITHLSCECTPASALRHERFIRWCCVVCDSDSPPPILPIHPFLHCTSIALFNLFSSSWRT